MKRTTIYADRVDREANEVPVLWHSLSEETIFKRLQTSLKGLESEQVIERQQEFGKNTLPTGKPPTLFQVILHQFASPLIYILLVAGVIAIIMDDLKDAIFIFAVILLNASIGTVQEFRAEQSAHALQSLLKIQARVRRNGVQQQILAEDLVPGDLVFLESGDKVPADIRLVQTNNLGIDESFLTGESIAAVKKVKVLSEDTSIGDRTNIAFAGSTVTTGRGTGLVIGTGLFTEVGKIAQTITETGGAKPPLVIRMEQFAHQISVIVLIFAAFLGVLAYTQGMALNEVFFLVIAMAVSAIPEGLPVALTVALSLATSRMAKRNVIVRKLPAVESLGSCTCIATDKTGTLTVNQQTAKLIFLPNGKRFHITGEGYNASGDIQADDEHLVIDDQTHNHLNRLGRAGILCNEGVLHQSNSEWVFHGDAIDVAFLAMGYKLGLDPEKLAEEYPTVAEIPFESEKRYAAKIYQDHDAIKIAMKGAVEALLPFCKSMRVDGHNRPIDKKYIEKKANALADEGYRVIAVAQGAFKKQKDFEKIEENDYPELTLLGLVGFIDPLRPETKDAVAKARQAGVRVVMITGDHPATAFAIASELGISEFKQDVVTGQQLAEIGSHDTPEFYETVKKGRVFARVSPHQKLHIVEALIKLGHFVAVTGDGVNDAPALRKANIGVAMGSGTDVAKDTASMIVTDDNFSSIVAGIEEGRFAYANTRKVTLLLISTGVAELLLITLAIIFRLPIPLLAVQILWLNLVTNGIQDVALAFEAGEPGVMSRPPRKTTEGIIDKRMIQQTLISGFTMGLVCFGVWFWLIANGWEETSARNILLLLIVLMQFFHVFNCRSEYLSVFRVPLNNNRVLVMGMLTALVIQILATELPFLQSILRTSPIPVQTWLLMGSIASVVLIVMEIYKKIQSREDNAFYQGQK